MRSTIHDHLADEQIEKSYNYWQTTDITNLESSYNNLVDISLEVFTKTEGIQNEFWDMMVDKLTTIDD